MTIATQAQKDNQAAIMASTGKAIKDSEVKAFDRYLSVVNFQPCDHPNGHITTEAATQCGLARAEAELATLPESIDLEARLAAVAVSLVTQDRFQCSKGCKFGHKTQKQAEACSQGSRAKQAKQVKAQIPVAMGGHLSQLQAPANPAPAPAPAPAKARLRSGSQGQVAKA